MTSPQTTTEVIATMAATGINGDNPLNLTAEIPSATETNAPIALQQETCPATSPADENKETNAVRENALEERIHQDSMRPEDVATPAPNHDGLPRLEYNDPAQQVGQEQNQPDLIHPENAAIPQLNRDGLPPEFEFPDQAGLAALMAMGQIGQICYDPNLAALNQAAEMAMPMMPMPNHDYAVQDDYVQDANRPEDRLVGYAKLCFEDGEFYMNTHSIKLGRDPIAHKAAQRREKEEERLKREAEDRARKGDSSAPRTPTQIKREHISYSMSVYSEKSGILRDGDDSDFEARAKRRQRRKASKKSKSTGSSHDLSRRNSLAQPPLKTHIYEAQYPDRVKEEHVAPLDPASLRPDPNECPLIPLHPPGNAPAAAYKSISREHVKIAYNFDKAVFEMHIYGRNGAFVDEVYHPMNSVVELKSGNMLQIGQVPLQFVLPDDPIPDATEGYSTGGKEMSYDFEEVKRDGVPEDSSPEPVSDEGQGVEDEDEDGEEIDEDCEEEEQGGDEDEEGVEASDQDESGLQEGGEGEGIQEEARENKPQPNPASGKKRGPGRPPKDGIMSQREKQLAKKAALENQKAQKSVSQPTSAPPPAGKEKKPVGRPRKHERPDPSEPEKPKRKYTKRKPKEPKEGDAKQEGSDGEGETTKEKREKKPKPPRSPSPTFIESELTPEQLQKPAANYVTLIYEALSNSKEGKLGLPQIYRAIQRKYPYFVLKVGTLGWQSSVRHNLSQHHAFKKCERDGKGWLWGIEPGVSIEKEKKRRTPPPQMGGPMHQQIYPGQQPYIGHPGQYSYPPHMGHPGMPPHMMQGPPRPGQPPHFMGPPAHMNGQPPAYNPQPPTNPINPGLAAAIAPQLAGNSTYSSPYAPKPPAPTAPAPSSSEQRPASEQQASTQASPSQTAPQGPPQNQTPHSQQPPGSQPQNQTPQHNPPQSQPYQGSLLHLAPPAPPAPLAPQQPLSRPTNPLPEPPQHSPQVISSVETFKAKMLPTMKEQDKGEEILNSAVSQVLGYSKQSSVPGNKWEQSIMGALRGMLEKIPEFNIKSNLAPALQANGQQQPQLATNQGEPQGNAATQQPPKSTGSDKPTPTVMRPTFTGQGQSRPSIPRPQLGTPNMKRTNSGSPAGAQQAGESTQVAGQKRALEDTDEVREAKRLNGSSTSQTPQPPQAPQPSQAPQVKV